jgi:hypothetical protein
MLTGECDPNRQMISFTFGERESRTAEDADVKWPADILIEFPKLIKIEELQARDAQRAQEHPLIQLGKQI